MLCKNILSGCLWVGLLTEPIVYERGLNPARTDTVDPDAVFSEIKSHTFGHGDDAALRRGVGARIGLTYKADH